MGTKQTDKGATGTEGKGATGTRTAANPSRVNQGGTRRAGPAMLAKVRRAARALRGREVLIPARGLAACPELAGEADPAGADLFTFAAAEAFTARHVAAAGRLADGWRSLGWFRVPDDAMAPEYLAGERVAVEAPPAGWHAWETGDVLIVRRVGSDPDAAPTLRVFLAGRTVRRHDWLGTPARSILPRLAALWTGAVCPLAGWEVVGVVVAHLRDTTAGAHALHPGRAAFVVPDPADPWSPGIAYLAGTVRGPDGEPVRAMMGRALLDGARRHGPKSRRRESHRSAA